MSTTPRADTPLSGRCDQDRPPPRTRTPSPRTPDDNFSLSPAVAAVQLITASAEPRPDEADGDVAPPSRPLPSPPPLSARPTVEAKTITGPSRPSTCQAVTLVDRSATAADCSDARTRRAEAAAGSGSSSRAPSLAAAELVMNDGSSAGQHVTSGAVPAAVSITPPVETAISAPAPTLVASAAAVPVSVAGPVVAGTAERHGTEEIAPASLVVPPGAAAEPVVASVADTELAAGQVATAERSSGARADAARLRNIEEQRKRHAAILAVNADPSLSDEEKNQRVHAIHLKRCVSLLEQKAAEIAAAKRNKSHILSYHNEEKGVLGCVHYPRKCVIKPVCCDAWFSCRLCHDADTQTHKCDRRRIQEVKCMECGEEQPVSGSCRSCSVSFARYFCEKCRLYDDTEGKPLYHCDKCGICRVGKENYHCDNCNACVAGGPNVNQHRCVQNALDVACPCCQLYLYDSVKKVVFIKCGHAMHTECLLAYSRTCHVCPLCHKEMGEVTALYESFDREVRANPMPSEYANHRAVLKCYECEAESNVKYHMSNHHRCTSCTSYNTYILHQYVAEEGAASAGAARSASLTVTGAPAGEGSVDAAGGAGGP